MAAAFGQFDEPHAWLIRSLIEYGWPDTSRMGGRVPAGVLGGLNLRGFPDSLGRDGVILEIPATADGQVCTEDNTYQVQVRVIRGQTGPAICARCPDANFMQEFSIDSANPTWAAGYLHQAISQYFPQFVTWRLQGGQVSWAQRSGMPDVTGEACSPMLAAYVGRRIAANERFDTGPSEGWWMGDAGVQLGGGAAIAPIAVAGRGAGPVYVSEAARKALGGARSIDDVKRARAISVTSGPSTALMAVTALGMFEGFLFFVNAVNAIYEYQELVSGAVSVVLSLGLIMGGVLSLLGAWQLRTIKGKVLPLWSMIYVALIPICCVFGIPVTMWAVRAWRDPSVASLR